MFFVERSNTLSMINAILPIVRMPPYSVMVVEKIVDIVVIVSFMLVGTGLLHRQCESKLSHHTVPVEKHLSDRKASGPFLLLVSSPFLLKKSGSRPPFASFLPTELSNATFDVKYEKQEAHFDLFLEKCPPSGSTFGFNTKGKLVSSFSL